MVAADLDAYISSKVASGEFRSEQEFLREAALVYRELEERYLNLRTTIQDRIQQAEAGDVTALDFEAIKAEGRRRLVAGRATD
jgi:putative addiction module CopG family antidote